MIVVLFVPLLVFTGTLEVHFFVKLIPMYTSIKSFFEKCLSANKPINCPYSVAWPNDHPYFIAVPKNHPYFIALDLDSQEGILPLR